MGAAGAAMQHQQRAGVRAQVAGNAVPGAIAAEFDVPFGALHDLRLPAAMMCPSLASGPTGVNWQISQV